MTNLSTQDLEQIGEGIRYMNSVYNAFLSRMHELENQQKAIIENARKRKDQDKLKKVRKKLK